MTKPATLQEIREAVAAFRLGWPLQEMWNGATVLSSMHADGFVIHIQFQMPHRDTGKRGPVATQIKLHPDVFTIVRWKEFLYSEIRRTCLATLEHELDESILIDGERVFDPHKEEEEHVTLSQQTTHYG